MRRSLIAAVLLATGAAGCASHVPVAGADRLAPLEPPLQARLHAPMRGTLSFWVSRPAYIAVFEMIPEQGVSLVYPALPWQESRVDEGSQWALLSTIPGRWFYFAATPASFRYPSPRYLYLVASEHPLRIAQIQRSPMVLRRAMAMASFTVFNPRLTTDAIDRLIVPNVDADDWVSDLYILWPEIPLPRARTALALGRNGIPIVVASRPDPSAPADTAATPRDTLRAPKETGTTDPPGARGPRRKKVQDDEAGDGAQRTGRSVADFERVDVPWSPVGRGAESAAGPRDRTRQPTRGDAEFEPRWPRRAGDASERATDGDPAWRQPPSRGERRGGERADAPEAGGGRTERRAEPQRAEPRSEPRSEPRTESSRPAPARPEPRGEPTRQPPRSSEPPSAAR